MTSDTCYIDELRVRRSSIRVSEPWVHVRRTRREQGWKLHLSTIPTEAVELLRTTIPILNLTNTPFKFARDEMTLRRLNEGALGATQVGKFVTAYPNSDSGARRLAEDLAAATRGFHGPVVVTDLRLGDVLYARHGPFRGNQLRDRLGNVVVAIRSSDGRLVPHEYEVPPRSDSASSSPFADMVVAAEDRPTDGHLLGPGYLVVDVIKPGAKGSVFLALDLRDQRRARTCVLKEGRAYCASDAHGRDIRDRLRAQSRLLEMLAPAFPVPAPAAYFEVRDNGYLPLEFIPGHDLTRWAGTPFHALAARARREILASLQRVMVLVDRLHERGYVHRDLTPTNLRTSPDGNVWLLDFELAHELASNAPPFTQGTPGFMSPQQAASQTPAVADDVFALGSLAVFLLSGADPRRLISSADGLAPRRLSEISGIRRAQAEVIGAAVDADPTRRPAVRDLAEAVGFVERRARANRARIDIGRRLGGLLEEAATGLLDAYPTSGGIWNSVHIAGVQRHEGGAGLASYRSTSRGVAGVVYALSRLATFGVQPHNAMSRVQTAVDWLLAHHPTTDDQLPGLHFGEAGVAVAISSAVAAGLLPPGEWVAGYTDEALAPIFDWPDVTHGAAGQGLAALACADNLGRPELEDRAYAAATYLVETQTQDGAWILPEGAPGITGAVMTGFAHGAAGCLYLLAEAANRTGSGVYLSAATRAAEWLETVALPTPHGGLRWPTRAGGSDIWHWWCHGAPGIALGLLRLYAVTGSDAHRCLAERALRGIPEAHAPSNLGQCHGLAGVGEVYFEAARVLLEERWLGAATSIGLDLASLARRSEAGAYWLVEDHDLATADLMIGGAGVVHFLLRLSLGPHRLSPPLLPLPASRA